MLARQRCVLRLLSSGYYQDWRGDEVSSLISLLSRLSVKEIKPRSRLYSHLSHFGNSISLLKTNKCTRETSTILLCKQKNLIIVSKRKKDLVYKLRLSPTKTSKRVCSINIKLTPFGQATHNYTSTAIELKTLQSGIGQLGMI